MASLPWAEVSSLSCVGIRVVRLHGRLSLRLLAAVCGWLLGVGALGGAGVAQAGQVAVTGGVVSESARGDAVSSRVAPVTVPGGGLRRTDCVSTFRVSAGEALRGRRLVCTDGDPACDEDGVVDGVCTLALAVCVNDSSLGSCTSPGVAWLEVAHAEDDGDPRFDPEFQALQARIDSALDLPEREADVCSSDSLFRVPVDGPRRAGSCRAGRKQLELDARSVFENGRAVRDRDRLHLVCRPAPQGCDPQQFFAGTFDRIQRQIFDRRCATGGCHDSESNAGGLLLEHGASHPSLVGVAAANPSAAAAGLLRVSPGHSEQSFLWRKLNDELAVGEGERMPQDSARLPRHLLTLVEEWIAAGAPQDGWVAAASRAGDEKRPGPVRPGP